MQEQFVDKRYVRLPTLDEARNILGGRLPTIIENTQFDKRGLIITTSGLRVPVYLASGLGFNKPGRAFLDTTIIPELEKRKAYVLDPFKACEEFLDPDVFNQKISVGNQRKLWESFNKIVGVINYGLLIPRSRIMFAILEGYPPDEGVAAEIAYMAVFGPVVGVRTDIRLAENLATGINPAITYFMKNPHSEGDYFEGARAYEQAYDFLEQLIKKLLENDG